MRSVRALAAAVLSLLAVSDVALAGAEAGRHPAGLSSGQSGQRLHPRGGDLLGQRSLHAGFQQPRHLQAGRRAKQPGVDRPGSRGELGLERRQQDAHLQAEAGRQMARRQAVHVRRRQMHLRHADGQVAAEVPQEPAQILVRRGRRRHDERRLRGRVQPEAAAAGAAGAARLRLYAGLSLPCFARRHAHQADRHRPVQVRRVQGQRIHQAHPQSRLLEKGPAASRRHRVHHHPQPFDGHSGVYRRQVRHDVSDRGIDPAAQGRQGAGAERGMRGRADQRQHQHHRQLVRRRPSTISIFAARWRWRSTARRSSRSCSKARPISAAPCCPRRAGCGRCRRKCWRRFRATAPT